MGQGLIVSYTGPSEPSYPHGSLCMCIEGSGDQFYGCVMWIKLEGGVCPSGCLAADMKSLQPVSTGRTQGRSRQGPRMPWRHRDRNECPAPGMSLAEAPPTPDGLSFPRWSHLCSPSEDYSPIGSPSPSMSPLGTNPGEAVLDPAPQFWWPQAWCW